MDKIKEQLGPVLKYAFWIGTAVVLLGASVVWYLSTGELTRQYGSRESTLTRAASTISSLRGELPEHPNDQSHTEMQSLIEKRQQEVLESWRSLFERQRDILTWPEEELTDRFLDKIRDKIPIEVHVAFGDGQPDPIEQTLRTQYQRYIADVLPSIASRGGTEWTAKFDPTAGGRGMMGGGGPMGMGGPPMGMGGPPMGMGMGMMGESRGVPEVTAGGIDDGPLVRWDEANQSTLLNDLFPWRGSVPSTLEIYYSQENLWILRQMMDIIAEVNDGAEQRYQADIRQIKRLAIGSSVSFDAGEIRSPTGAMGGTAMADAMAASMMQSMTNRMGGASQIDPADDRYVDPSLEPIEAGTLRSALTSEKPTDVALAVAKRVPVMMAFKMDQRAVPELLATCGSVPLMVQVQQVRILPPDASVSGGGSMTGGPPTGMGGGQMGMGGPSMGMGGPPVGMGGPPGMGTPARPVDDYPLDVTVEVYGLIYIYNPPDRKQLGLEAIDADTELGEGEEIVATDRPAAVTPAAVAAGLVEAALPSPAAGVPPADAATTPQPATNNPPPNGPPPTADPAPPGLVPGQPPTNTPPPDDSAVNAVGMVGAS